MLSLRSLALPLSVLLASNAFVLPTDGDDQDVTTTFKGFSFAARATPKVYKGSSDNTTLMNLTNELNMEYTGKVNVGGHDFTLIIDTGSTDLWVSNAQKIQVNKTTDITLNLTYGIGSAFGNVSYGNVSFGGYEVENQAFLVVSKALDTDNDGILGLGLDGLSMIEKTAKSPSAQSVMANMFAQHPSIPDFIGLALDRSDDGEETAGGVLSIGEYDPQFSNVTHAPKYPVTPTYTSRWTIAMNAMTINGKQFPLKSNVKGTKKGQAIALIDSGTSLAYLPSDAVDALYSSINGSVHVKNGSQDAWFVPCLSQVNLSFTFGRTMRCVPGREEAYPINPMELTTPITLNKQNDQYTVCIGAFRPPLQGSESNDLDFLLGDIFMRNVYSVFNFGNASAGSNNAKNASIQFLSRTNRDQVYANFENNRKDSLKALAPLFDLTKLYPNGSTDDGGRLVPPQAV